MSNRGLKNDDHAREHWGAAYGAIPKSVFASLAWHLANVASGNADNRGAAEARAVEELRALGGSIIPERQASGAARAILKADGDAVAAYLAEFGEGGE